MSASRAAAPLRQELRRALGSQANTLRLVRDAAREAGASAYLVGGPVRDLLLGQQSRDLDVLVSERLEPIARRVARDLGGSVRLHPSFLTATVEGQGDGLRVDLAAARREHYARPGALPVVTAASVEEDLARRDFSVNAIALPLDRAFGSELLDPSGGVNDLAERRLRVLHEASFRDDPTRLYRAARYSARLRFGLEPATARLARAAVRGGALDTVSGERIRHELEHLVAEVRPDRAARETARLGLWSGLVAGWRSPPDPALRRFAKVKVEPPWPEAADAAVLENASHGLFLVASPLRVHGPAIGRLDLRGRPAQTLASELAALPRLRRRLARKIGDGTLDAELAAMSESGLVLAYCSSPPPVARRIARFAQRVRHVASPLDGHEARALGARGPAVGALLRAARQRALDGDRVDAAWLQRWLARN